ncbi:hypothetical protein, partial, partial [Absidia glauca]
MARCSSCGRSGHSTRAYRRCIYNRRNVCSSCGESGHVDMNCPNDSDAPSSSRTLSRVVCGSCGKEGHNRISHKDCDFYASYVSNIDPFKNIARMLPSTIMPLTHSVGRMVEFRCIHCGAYLWKGELYMERRRDPTSTLCCSHGTCIIPRPNATPEPLKTLLRANNPEAREFRTNIRQYNCSFSFT